MSRGEAHTHCPRSGSPRRRRSLPLRHSRRRRRSPSCCRACEGVVHVSQCVWLVPLAGFVHEARVQAPKLG